MCKLTIGQSSSRFRGTFHWQLLRLNSQDSQQTSHNYAALARQFPDGYSVPASHRPMYNISRDLSTLNMSRHSNHGSFKFQPECGTASFSGDGPTLNDHINAPFPCQFRFWPFTMAWLRWHRWPEKFFDDE